MMAEEKTTVRIRKDITDRIDLIVKDKEVAGEIIDGKKPSRDVMTNKLLEVGLSSPQISFDDTQKQSFFGYLKTSDKEPYKAELAELSLTERELIDMAITRSGKTYDQLIKDAVLAHAKEQITFTARRQWLEQSGVDSPETRLMKAFAELTEEAMEGRIRLRGGKVNLSAVSSRARVNYSTAKKWAEQNQPELLE